MSLRFRGESSDHVGKELEEAYANAFGGKMAGGFNDHGKDIIGIPDSEVQAVQVKSSVPEMKKFFAESLRQRNFIPMCVGLPGTKEEMVDSIKNFGAWIGDDIPGKERLLKLVAQVRDLCYNENRLIEQLRGLAPEN